MRNTVVGAEPLTFTPIGIVHSCFKDRFGVPRQSGLAPHAYGSICIYPPFHVREAWTDLRSCSHIWVQFVFHQQKAVSWKPRVKAPRLGGNKTLSVFASRSPNRPNAIGLSALELRSIQFEANCTRLAVTGLDMVHGTPVLDIKPYVPYADCLKLARNACAPEPPVTIGVEFTAAADAFLAEREARGEGHWRTVIIEILQQNPRPAYHTAGGRLYAMRLEDLDIQWFCVQDSTGERITVENIQQPHACL